jgi:protein-tyrosine phosphatase
LSFLLLALAYGRGQVQVFGKREDGSRAPVNGFLLSAFILFGRIVWELQTRFSREPAAHAVGESLLVARRLRTHEVPANVAAIVDLTCEFLDPASIRAMPGYRCLPILDAGTPVPEALAELVRRIALPPQGRLLIHCANGHGRAGLVAAAWLIAQGLAGTSAQALDMLRAARPRIRLRRCQRESLEAASRILAVPDNLTNASNLAA